MKRIRLTNQTEIEVYDISDTKESLTISFLNADSNNMEAVFSSAENLAIIQYFVGTDLMKGYAGFTKLQRCEKQMGVTIRIDYTTPDSSTESGFAETTVDILTITLIRPSRIVEVAAETAQNTADIDYIAMETGVSV